MHRHAATHRPATRRPATARAAGLGLALLGLAIAGCSGTVEASYRPPPPPPAAPTPLPSPTPEAPPTGVATIACGPDQITVEVGPVQTESTSRAVPLLVRARLPIPCEVANPVGVQLQDEAGASLTTHVQVADLPEGRTAVDTLPSQNGAMIWVQWRTAPSTPQADPATDCVAAKNLLLTLTDAAPPIPVAATLTACDSGTVYVSPAEANPG